MQWIFQALGVTGPLFKEAQIDCKACQVRKPVSRSMDFDPSVKCCQFSPFISGFGVGAWLSDGHKLSDLSGWEDDQIQATRMGLLHPLEHRLDRKALCLHFDIKSGGCKVWRHRPPICFSFFCGSRYPDGLATYASLEKWLLRAEAQLLKFWFDREMMDPQLWQMWSDWMDEKPRACHFPERLGFKTKEEVGAFYLEMFERLKEPEYQEFLETYKNSWKLGLAREPLLC